MQMPFLDITNGQLLVGLSRDTAEALLMAIKDRMATCQEIVIANPENPTYVMEEWNRLKRLHSAINPHLNNKSW